MHLVGGERSASFLLTMIPFVCSFYVRDEFSWVAFLASVAFCLHGSGAVIIIIVNLSSWSYIFCITIRIYETTHTYYDIISSQTLRTPESYESTTLLESESLSRKSLSIGVSVSLVFSPLIPESQQQHAVLVISPHSPAFFNFRLLCFAESAIAKWIHK